jgi:hypothetical protein
LFVHRHTGGLENSSTQGHIDLFVHRHTGGLENSSTQGHIDLFVHRHTGGLESSSTQGHIDLSVLRHTGGLEIEVSRVTLTCLFTAIRAVYKISKQVGLYRPTCSPPHRRIRSKECSLCIFQGLS